MPIKRFYISADGGKVTDVGLRPALAYHATSTYNLKIVAHNIFGEKPTENRVEVIVKGDERSISLFRNYVEMNDIRLLRQGSMYKVSKSENYKGKEPNWDYCLNTINAEQMYHGITAMSQVAGSLGSIDKQLGSIDKQFGIMIEKYGVFGEYMKQIVSFQNETKEKLTNLDYLKDIKEKIDSLTK
ncbi:hypothetical protein [Candidatus Nitrosotenuis aquarius]|uniref:hypothetical protein n=1 Tax=Candidatus Nitrosotenuis aquarius TaxID=1846278 RepID=UPI000C1E40BA|nr:hypothetical protein [Candidatus Nitrosotenuis aquarius]